MNNVLAVVLNWNGGNQTWKCIEYLLRQEPQRPDIVVVDNASTDGSLERLRGAQLPCTFITFEKNKGFAVGMNAGMQKALEQGYDFVWLVNNDAFPAADCLAILLDRMRCD